MNKKIETRGEALHAGLTWMFTGGFMIFPLGMLLLIIVPVGLVMIGMGSLLMLTGIGYIIASPFYKVGKPNA